MPCSVDGCPKPTRSPGTKYCEMHYTRYRRHGDPHVYIPHRDRAYRNIKEVVDYSGAHKRVIVARGAASRHLCWCGNSAAQWSYNRADPNERQSGFGAYSLDPGYYDPRCVPCHKRADLAFIRAAKSSSQPAQ